MLGSRVGGKGLGFIAYISGRGDDRAGLRNWGFGSRGFTARENWCS